jgi:Protein of unknown function (DUF4199)
MDTSFRGGLVLGALVVLWTFVMGITGWYKDPVLLNLFWVVVLIQIAVLLWALRRTAREGTRYAGQIWKGTVISLIGGVIIFCGSLVFTTVVFPHYFEELRSLQVEMLKQAGQTEAQIEAAVAATAATATPFMQALFGLIGTVVTGAVASALIGAFARAK